jgi:hypothetical protein
MGWTDYSRENFEEKMLWACILRRTVFDYVLYRGVGKHKLRWQQAHRFIFGDARAIDGENGLSFDEICGLFGWEPGYLRRKVKELDRGDIRKLEAMKFKDSFDEGTATILVQAATWKTGQPVPIFVPYNYNPEYREHMRLREVKRAPSKRLKSIVPVGHWALASA